MDAARRAPTPPHFRRWTGEGSVGVQLQHGLAVPDAFGADPRLQIDQEPSPVPGRGGRPRPRVRLRIGSADRAPIWGEWPVILHRPLPLEGRIKTAQVTRRTEASREVWSLCLTVEIPDPVQVESDRIVALDLGWRRTEAASLRAGRWSDDGATGHDVILDARYRDRMRKAEDLRSIRDRRQNDIRAALLAWREAQEVLAPEMQERLAYLPQWRSPARFAALALWWRAHREPGDEAIYLALEAWRQRDKHLWLYETGTRTRALRQRREQYRCVAADLAATYDGLVVERLDLSALAAIPPPESSRESHPRARSQRHETAPSELRRAAVEAFRAQGKRIWSVAPTGPAEALLRAYRERSGVEEIVVAARVPRFKRLRESAGESVAAAPPS